MASGIVAAGARGTAAAAGEVLRAGGNAVDAAVAACLACSAHEPTLTSLGGGGMILIQPPPPADPWLLDFFSDTPSLMSESEVSFDFRSVDLDFGPQTQRFNVGRAAAAIPGMLPGLDAAHSRFGRLPIAEVVAPAITDMETGIDLCPYLAWTIELLAPILTYGSDCAGLFAPDGKLLAAGDRFRNPDLAALLREISRRGIGPVYRDEVIPRIVRGFGSAVRGRIEVEDLTGYEPRWRTPLTFPYRQASVRSNPPPSRGGAQMAALLKLVESVGLPSMTDREADYLRVLAAAMDTVDRHRDEAEKFQEPDVLERWRAHMEGRDGCGCECAPGDGAGGGSTTHISVIDSDGWAAALTSSHGEGCGYLIEGTGILMNNFLGEEDLVPTGQPLPQPGTRLRTNMCPTVIVEPERTAVLGSGGSNRIRTALAQAVIHLVDHRLSPEEVVGRGRLHVEGGRLSLETFDLLSQSSPDPLEPVYREVVRFSDANLFFGGVHLAVQSRDGSVAGAGDPRRSGAVVVIR